MVIGNEGALCFITEVTVKLFRFQPEHNVFQGYLRRRPRDGRRRSCARSWSEGYRPSVARVYSPDDAAQHFSDFAGGRCVVVLVAEGPRRITEATSAGIEEIAGRARARPASIRV